MAVKIAVNMLIRGKIPSGAALPAFDRMLVKAFKEAGLFLEGEVAKRTPVNTGKLRKSISSAVKGSPVYRYGRVFSPLGYAKPVEEGQTLHWPPPDPVRLWVKRKISRVKRKLKKMLGVKKLPPGVVAKIPGREFLVFAVQRSIALGTTKGTAIKGVHMFKKAFEDAHNKDVVWSIFSRHKSKFIAEMNL